MPTYEYECRKCGHTFEELREITAPPRSRCPLCRGQVQKLVSAGAGIVFKGSGWYVTDSRKSSAKTSLNTVKNDSGTSAAAAPADAASTDAVKSAAATATTADAARRKTDKAKRGRS